MDSTDGAFIVKACFVLKTARKDVDVDFPASRSKLFLCILQVVKYQAQLISISSFVSRSSWTVRHTGPAALKSWENIGEKNSVKQQKAAKSSCQNCAQYSHKENEVVWRRAGAPEKNLPWRNAPSRIRFRREKNPSIGFPIGWTN
jgi:hypothetical protein